jgi:RNA polymerase sigma-70 factor (ECF subfamily)
MNSRARNFEFLIWPHVRSAWNYARWLVRNSHDAEDVLQESLLKAYKSLDTFRGADARSWVLAIVRNTAMNFHDRHKTHSPLDEMDPADASPDPERALIDRSRVIRLRMAISNLEPEFREAIVLREIEDLSYKEIAAVLNIPVGTVMSRLARARQRLLTVLTPSEEVRHHDVP